MAAFISTDNILLHLYFQKLKVKVEMRSFYTINTSNALGMLYFWAHRGSSVQRVQWWETLPYREEYFITVIVYFDPENEKQMTFS